MYRGAIFGLRLIPPTLQFTVNSFKRLLDTFWQANDLM